MPLIPFFCCSDDMQLQAADLVASEFEQVGTSDDVVTMFREQLSAPSSVWILHEGGQFMGVFSIQCQPSDGFVPCFGNFAVPKEARGAGVGTRIIDEALSMLAIQGWTDAYLWCNAGLKMFYEKRGWSQMDKRDGDLFVMTKALELPSAYAEAFTDSSQYCLLSDSEDTPLLGLFGQENIH